MQFVGFILLSSLAGASTSFTYQGGYFGPENLVGLSVVDLAAPWGFLHHAAFCKTLEEFNTVTESASMVPGGPSFKYFNTAYLILRDLCLETDAFYQAYKEFEKCYEYVAPFYFLCYENQSSVLRDEDIDKVAVSFLKDFGKDEKCVNGTRLIFCMADKIMRHCDNSFANQFYLEIIWFSNLHGIFYCEDASYKLRKAVKSKIRRAIKMSRKLGRELSQYEITRKL